MVEFYLNTGTKKTSLVDLYSRNGKLLVLGCIEILFDTAQIAKDMTLDCITMHASDTRMTDFLR